MLLKTQILRLQLKEHFEKELGEANTQKLFDEIEVPLLRVLATMELEGINLDKDFLNSLSEHFNTDIEHSKKAFMKPLEKNLILLHQSN